MSAEEAQAAIDKIEHWRHRIEVAPGIVTPGSQDSERKLASLRIPEHFDGRRLLDVGASDGYFSFVAESRGAEVVAIDRHPTHTTGFETAASLLRSSVAYRRLDVYDLDPEDLGTFDFILFLSVLYHLRHPLLALDKLSSVANPDATLWVESFVLDGHVVEPKTGEKRGELASLAPGLADVPIVQFYAGDELFSDSTNSWGPNLMALKAMVESAGFAIERIEAAPTSPKRALVVARKID